jgi:hypothetical protein
LARGRQGILFPGLEKTAMKNRTVTVLLSVGLAGLVACATSARNTKDLAQRALSQIDQLTPKPYPCDSGWARSQSGYVVAVADWAEQAGLRLGDRIAAIGGIPVTNQDERSQAMQKFR